MLKGDRPTVGLILVRQPRGEDEKEARCEDHQLSEVLGIDVELSAQPAVRFVLLLSRKARTRREPWLGTLIGHHGQTWRDHFGSYRGGRPAAEERQGDDRGGQ